MTDVLANKKGPATELIHAGEDAPLASSLVTPIYETTTFVFDSAEDVEQYQAGKSGKYLYSRYENPTVIAAERKLAALEQAEMALTFSSGMGATATTLMALLNAGDEVVCSAAIYGGTLHLLSDLLTRFGVTARFASLEELADPSRIIGPATRLIWFESPINPTLRCVDIRRIAAACRQAGIWSVIDNTFASPINQRPLDLGVDVSMQSVTKYLNGHSDVTGGAVTGPRSILDRISKTRRLLGTVIDPQPSFALARGLKTLPLRIARHNSNAEAVARFLDGDRRVTAVFYPGLPSHPDHAIARSQMKGFGGMVCFDVGGDYRRACRVFDRLRVVKRAASLGGVESIVSLPVLTSHFGYTDTELERAGVTRGMLRLSVGLEDPEDLVADLDQALG
jgi:cystathionine beta-lyase/cystathionine gamma-synthase